MAEPSASSSRPDLDGSRGEKPLFASTSFATSSPSARATCGTIASVGRAIHPCPGALRPDAPLEPSKPFSSRSRMSRSPPARGVMSRRIDEAYARRFALTARSFDYGFAFKLPRKSTARCRGQPAPGNGSCRNLCSRSSTRAMSVDSNALVPSAQGATGGGRWCSDVGMYVEVWPQPTHRSR